MSCETLNGYGIETHPFPTLITQKTRTLIVGTFPPPRFSLGEHEKQLHENDIPWYYGSRSNLFWRLLELVYGFDLNLKDKDKNAVVERLKNLLLVQKLGITDIVETARRLRPSASDGDLKPLSYREVFYRLADYPDLRLLLPTSKQAFAWLGACLRDQGWQLLRAASGELNQYRFRCNGPGRELELRCAILPSPSPRANQGANSWQRKLDIYKELLPMQTLERSSM